MLEKLHDSKVFSKIDLRSGYCQIKIREGDEWKTAFSHAFWAIKRFQHVHKVNESSFKPYIDKFVVVYFDDILIYSQSEKEHLEHLTQIMMVLEKEKLFGNLKQCTFFTPEVTFLGYIITAQGIKVDDSKIEAIWSGPIPKSIHDIRSFYRLASFYRRFIKNFSTIIALMTEVLKGIPFRWNPKA